MILVAFIFYVRYRQVKQLDATLNINKNIERLNKYCLRLGLAAALGTSIVANFQETNIFTVHVIGAFMAFGLGAIYQLLEVRLCFLRKWWKISKKLLGNYILPDVPEFWAS